MPGDAPLFDHLVLIDDPEPRGAAFNMGMDEALLRLFCDGIDEAGALLRFYRWERASVSFGYFEKPDVVASQFPSRPLVRRWTGGGIVEHGGDTEMTYALIVPRSGATELKRVGVSYRLVHGALVRALRERGIAAELAEEGSARDGENPGNLCFTRPVCADVLNMGQKIAGAAQRRTRLGLLHQGSIRAPEIGGWTVAERKGLAREFAAALAGENAFREREFTGDEIEAATLLEVTKYANNNWPGEAVP